MGIGMSSHQNPWGLSPYGQGQGIGSYPGQAFGGNPFQLLQSGQPLQQILQILQTVPYQLQQLQQQIQQLQQLEYQQQQQVQQVLQIVPAQLQQLQQLIQFVPQQIQHLQQGLQGQQSFGQPGMTGGTIGSPFGIPFQALSGFSSPFAGQPGQVM